MTQAHATLLGQLGEAKKRALISLLADDDSSVYQAVRTQLLSFGPQVAQWVKPETLSDNAVLRRRALEIQDHFGRQTADEKFLQFCQGHAEEFDIEQAALLLARTQFPRINPEGYTALLDDFASELRERLDLHGPAEYILHVINDYLFDELKFTGNEKDYYDPDNSYLNTVLDRRTGNPISICLVYLLITKRLRLPMAGIGLPGHFLCRYQNSRYEIYVDAFNRGKSLSRADCIKYLMKIRHRLDESYLAPVTPRRVLLRMCANLHQIYTQTKANAEADRLQRYLVALANKTIQPACLPAVRATEA
jgi:regulator of sirC expression with transglutaminase-like and TPR domain